MANITDYIINADTGEITGEVYEGDRLHVRRETQDKYASFHITDFNKGKSFVKIYDEVIPLLEKYLKAPEFKMAICIAPHVSYEDCIIRESCNRNSKILTLKDFAAIHDYKYDYVKKIMLSLKKKGVIGKHETGNILEGYTGRYGTVYTVNPYIYFRGSDMISPVYSFYSSSGWKELLESG